MDCSKVGGLILALRKEKGLTQKQIADAMNISDKAISKWERGLGCPDVSLLGTLSEILGVSVERILTGDIGENPMDGGNMKRLKFYVCPNCGSIVNSTGAAEISCCGRKLEPLTPQPADSAHAARLEIIDNQYFVTFDHDMNKAHFISFVAYLSSNRLTLVRLYPEQEAQLNLPLAFDGKLYFYCNKHGLFVNS
ncbi:helix-turn-helix domain-containing protein [Oscillospiraceae bacterium LTW-04]|nr:helix-turn-helix domain-containing protein [Oscillospiraceae bacterium MB24-C1]